MRRRFLYAIIMIIFFIFSPFFCIGQEFIDVPKDFWAYYYIDWLKGSGITKGCASNLFCPEDVVTRGQMAAFIVRANYGETFSYTKTPYFLDVPSNHPFFKYIQKLRDEGITKGCAPNLYCINDPVTRAQMAVFLVRAFFNEALAGNPSLSDIGHYRIYNVDSLYYDVQASIRMAGNSYYKGVKIKGYQYYSDHTEVEYNIGGWYSTLSGLIGIDDNCYAATNNPSGTSVAMVEFLGDGKQLKVIELRVGDLPKEFSVNVKDVIRLTINIVWKKYGGIVDIANPIIE